MTLARLHRWRRLLCGSAPRNKPRPRSVRLQVEPLETRVLLSFTLGKHFATGTHPVALVLADFNGDGKLDVATANLKIGRAHV